MTSDDSCDREVIHTMFHYNFRKVKLHDDAVHSSINNGEVQNIQQQKRNFLAFSPRLNIGNIT